MDIFRGLKFSPNAEIGKNSHSWMDTIYTIGKGQPEGVDHVTRVQGGEVYL